MGIENLGQISQQGILPVAPLISNPNEDWLAKIQGIFTQVERLGKMAMDFQAMQQGKAPVNQNSQDIPEWKQAVNNPVSDPNVLDYDRIAQEMRQRGLLDLASVITMLKSYVDRTITEGNGNKKVGEYLTAIPATMSELSGFLSIGLKVGK